MKKFIISAVISSLLLFQLSSCKKIKDAIFSGLDVNIPAVQFTIPAIIAVNPSEIELGSFSQQFNLDSIIRANTGGVFTINSVSTVKIKEVNINLANADQLNNLANFESIRFVIKSNNNNTATDLFSISFPESYSSSITVTPENTHDLLNYLKGSVMTYTVYGKMRRITTKPLTMSIAVKVRVS